MTFFNSGSLRLLTALTLVLTASACGTEGETSDTSSGSSTAAGSTTGDLTGDSTSVADTSTSATNPTTTDATTTDAMTTDAPDSTGGELTTTGDATTDDSTTGGAIADCGFDPGVTFTHDALVYQLESDDGTTCVWLERRNDSEPDVIYKAVPYSLLEWKSGHAGVVTHVTDAAQLTWESTHHNWSDVATATHAGVRYRLEDWYALDESSDSFRLYAYDAGTDALLWGPIALHPHAP